MLEHNKQNTSKCQDMVKHEGKTATDEHKPKF